MISVLRETGKTILFKGSYSLNRPFFPPDTLQISLTSRCNLKCKMCSVNKYLTRPEDEMEFGEISKIISQAKKQFGVKRLILTGGEPLLLFDLVAKTVKFANEQKLAVLLTTNGFYLEQYAERLAGLGVSHFHVSMDGLEDTHNYIRQNGASFAKAANSVKFLADLRHKYNFKYSIGVGMVILGRNIPEFYDLFVQAASLGADVFDILPYLPDNTDFSNTGKTSLWPDEAAVSTFLQLYKKIKRSGITRTRLNDFIDAGLMAKYYLRKMRKGDWQCMAGFKNIFVTMSDPKRQGRSEPCVFMCKAHLPVRDYDYDLKKIWHSEEARLARRDIRNCQSYCYQPCFSLPSILKLLKLK